MLNIETQTLSELVAQASDDLHSFADANMIDEAKLIGEVARCNEVLGVRINKPRQRFIKVVDGIAELPRDFYKLECIFAIYEQERFGTGIIDYGNQMQQTDCEPECPIGWGTTECYDDGCLCYDSGKYWIERKPGFANKTLVINTFTPLSISGGNCTSYCPNRGYSGMHCSIDKEEGVINLPFKTGEIFVSYLANFTDPNTGELLVPFHPMLNPYYMYTVKAKILENVFMNSEADVERKLVDARRQRNLSFGDAVDFILSAKGKAWIKYNKEREQEFYSKWFKMFM